MVTAKINFLGENIIADLSCSQYGLYKNLQSIGVLTVPDLIMLDNARTLKIELTPTTETGREILNLVDMKRDTLGAVNKLCNKVQKLDDREFTIFTDNLSDGKYKSLGQAIESADKLKEQHRKKRDERGR